jgi:hypothetical protein
MDDIRRKKLEKIVDAREWTALEMLEDVTNELKDIPNENIRIGVFVWVKNGEKWKINYWCAGVNNTELIALTANASYDMIKNFGGD